MAEQGIEECGLSGVRPSGDDGGNAFREKVPFAVGVDKAREFRVWSR